MLSEPWLLCSQNQIERDLGDLGGIRVCVYSLCYGKVFDCLKKKKKENSW